MNNEADLFLCNFVLIVLVWWTHIPAVHQCQAQSREIYKSATRIHLTSLDRRIKMPEQNISKIGFWKTGKGEVGKRTGREQEGLLS